MLSQFSLPGLDSDAQIHANRIIADGGIVTDLNFLSNFIRDLKIGNCYSILDGLWIPIAIRKDTANLVNKIYDIGPRKNIGNGYYDAGATSAVFYQIWEDGQIDNKPWIRFDPSKGGYSHSGMIAKTQPGTIIAIFRRDHTGSSTKVDIIHGSTGSATWEISYYFSASSVSMYAGSPTLSANTDQMTLAQITAKYNGSNSYLRRKGTTIGQGTTGSQDFNTGFFLGGTNTGTDVMDGPIAFWLIGTMTDDQMYYIENLLNTKYYPSTIA